MKLILLTTAYSTTTDKSGVTPVVHYFAREWVKQGNNVTVFHLKPRFPRLFYVFSKIFQYKLNSILGMCVPTEQPKNYDSVVDGVRIHCRTYNKFKPHSRITKSQKEYIIKEIGRKCKETGIPDVFIGHWENPQLDILPELKELYNKPTCLVFHSNGFILDKSFGPDFEQLLKKIDIIGFRNPNAKVAFEKKYWIPQKSFIAYSGVSEEFLDPNHISQHKNNNKVRNFIFVGSLMDRKHPVEVLQALEFTYKDTEFNLTYVGDGDCKQKIENTHAKYKNGNIFFTGRIARHEVIEYLNRSDVFVMISRGEIFGLVYLEAMAIGLITIGSKGEGIDGIIIDGENGFLCTPGDSSELASILNRIKNMTPAEINQMSRKARETALAYSDYEMANKYITFVKDNI